MAEAPQTEKATLRAQYLNRRRALSPDHVRERSAAAIARLRAQPEMRHAPACLVYLSSKDNELDTLDLVNALLREGRTVLVPVSKRDRSILWSRLESLEDLAPSPFGILEPRPECLRPATPPPDSVAVVPGIAFTRDGRRIGYGAGYYDRFLAAFPGPKLGLAFEAQLADDIPVEPHDVPLDAVVTEKAVYRRLP